MLAPSSRPSFLAYVITAMPASRALKRAPGSAPTALKIGEVPAEDLYSSSSVSPAESHELAHAQPMR